MIFNITDIKTGKIKEKEVNFTYLPKEEDFKDKDFELLSDIDVNGKVYYADGGVYRFEGVMSATCKFVCDRCGNEFTSDYEAEFFEEYKEEIEDNDDDYFKLTSDQIDLSEGIVKNFLLNIPLKILCDENCEGVSYNSEEVFEKYADSDKEKSPFSSLKNLKF